MTVYILVGRAGIWRYGPAVYATRDAAEAAIAAMSPIEGTSPRGIPFKYVLRVEEYEVVDGR